MDLEPNLTGTHLTGPAAQIGGLADHYILCGAGRVGFYIAREFLRRRAACVVIDEDAGSLAALQEKLDDQAGHLHYIQGDATEEEALEAAGVSRARGLITAMGDDKDNLFVILTARSLNPGIRIVTRVNQETNREKLEKAGADKVISTNMIGGLRTASEMIRPEVVKFLDRMVQVTEKTKSIHFTQLPLTDIKTPELVQLLEAAKQDGNAPKIYVRDIGKYTGLLVVAIKAAEREGPDEDADGNDFYDWRRRYRFTPRGDVELESDDILVVVGTQDKLDEVRKTAYALDA
jgi:Trk K+ transport system NAD-binding subunit